MQLKWTTNLNFPLAKRTKQNEKKHLRLGYMQKTTYFCRTIISFYPHLSRIGSGNHRC